MIERRWRQVIPSIRPCIMILQNHLIHNLSALNTFSSYKVLSESIESFIDHHTTTTVTLHTKLLKIVFSLLPKSAFLKSNDLFVKFFQTTLYE
jgi:hypothetical protein